MLVITRKPGQRLRVGDAWIEIVSTKGRSVKLGVTAPKEVAVVRDDAKKVK